MYSICVQLAACGLDIVGHPKQSSWLKYSKNTIIVASSMNMIRGQLNYTFLGSVKLPPSYLELFHYKRYTDLKDNAHISRCKIFQTPQTSSILSVALFLYQCLLVQFVLFYSDIVLLFYYIFIGFNRPVLLN